MYYMDKRLNMRWLAVLFSLATVVCAFGVGNMPQSNNIAVSIEQSFRISPGVTRWHFGYFTRTGDFRGHQAHRKSDIAFGAYHVADVYRWCFIRHTVSQRTYWSCIYASIS